MHRPTKSTMLHYSRRCQQSDDPFLSPLLLVDSLARYARPVYWGMSKPPSPIERRRRKLLGYFTGGGAHLKANCTSYARKQVYFLSATRCIEILNVQQPFVICSGRQCAESSRRGCRYIHRRRGQWSGRNSAC
jgi:hypothetical protein